MLTMPRFKANVKLNPEHLHLHCLLGVCVQFEQQPQGYDGPLCQEVTA